jgi:wobble nucleotide-excising tRNase
MLTVLNSANRTAVIDCLDPLLENFESEYHYLFKRVFDEARRDSKPAALAEYYVLPNLARRLLESFLAFRYPGISKNLREKIDRVPLELNKRICILRFVHTYSHDDTIDDPGHDLSLLAETPQVLKEVLELIKAEDGQHYEKMVELVSTPEAAT